MDNGGGRGKFEQQRNKGTKRDFLQKGKAEVRSQNLEDRKKRNFLQKQTKKTKRMADRMENNKDAKAQRGFQRSRNEGFLQKQTKETKRHWMRS